MIAMSCTGTQLGSSGVVEISLKDQPSRHLMNAMKAHEMLGHRVGHVGLELNL